MTRHALSLTLVERCHMLNSDTLKPKENLSGSMGLCTFQVFYIRRTIYCNFTTVRSNHQNPESKTVSKADNNIISNFCINLARTTPPIICRAIPFWKAATNSIREAFKSWKYLKFHMLHSVPKAMTVEQIINEGRTDELISIRKFHGITIRDELTAAHTDVLLRGTHPFSTEY